MLKMFVYALGNSHCNMEYFFAWTTTQTSMHRTCHCACHLFCSISMFPQAVTSIPSISKYILWFNTHMNTHQLKHIWTQTESVVLFYWVYCWPILWLQYMRFHENACQTRAQLHKTHNFPLPKGIGVLHRVPQTLSLGKGILRLVLWSFEGMYYMAEIVWVPWRQPNSLTVWDCVFWEGD